MSESSEEQEEGATSAGLESLLTGFDEPSDVFEESGRVSLSTLFEMLAEPGRRYILTYVLLQDEYVSLSELVDFVVRVSGQSDADGRFRKELVTDLVQTHLPMLAEAGLIDYRIERQFIGPTRKTTTALPYLYLALKQVEAFEVDND